MVLMVEPIVKALRSLNLEVNKKIALTSAKGETYSQEKALEYSHLEHLVIIAGHYEGFDERILEYIDEEISLGDFVMTGGEITAAAVLDSVVRLLPGVLKKEGATEIESFYKVPLAELINAVGLTPELESLQNAGKTEVQLLEFPHYTRPEIFEDKKIPDVLLSGHHKEIYKWRLQQSYKQTLQKRHDLLDK
jgi:tRNA (guanine37-N1)-methyltransferase